jgi:AbrB family looped-hinge helix DNA binding protein
MKSAILSKKGWVVIPLEMRERYNLKQGDKLHIVDYGGVISIIPAFHSPIENSIGLLKGKTSLVQALLNSRAQDS